VPGSITKSVSSTAVLVVDDALDVGPHRRGGAVVGDVAAGDRKRRHSARADLGVSDRTGRDLQLLESVEEALIERDVGRLALEVGELGLGLGIGGALVGGGAVVAAGGNAEGKRRDEQQHRAEAWETWFAWH